MISLNWYKNILSAPFLLKPIVARINLGVVWGVEVKLAQKTDGVISRGRDGEFRPSAVIKSIGGTLRHFSIRCYLCLLHPELVHPHERIRVLKFKLMPER